MVPAEAAGNALMAGGVVADVAAAVGASTVLTY